MPRVRAGILNGIDDQEWNPQTDPHLEQNYTQGNFSGGKAANKAALQRELGLPERPDVSPSVMCPAVLQEQASQPAGPCRQPQQGGAAAASPCGSAPCCLV